MKLEQFKAECLNRPDHFIYFGDLDITIWGFSPFTRNRDSDVLEQSNFETVSSDLLERFPDSFVIENFNHWLCGWIDQLMVKTTNEEALIAARDWYDVLDNYPVANEEDYSRRQLEEYEEAWDNWASYDVKRLIEKNPVLFANVIDEDEFYDATDEQEEVAKRVLVDHFLDYGECYIREEDFIGELVMALEGYERRGIIEEDRLTLTLDFEE